MDALCALPSWHPGPATVALHHLVETLTHMSTISQGGAAHVQILRLAQMFFSSALTICRSRAGPSEDAPGEAADALHVLLTVLLLRMARSLSHEEAASLPLFAFTRTSRSSTLS